MEQTVPRSENLLPFRATLATAALAVLFRVLFNDFVELDDAAYILNNPLLAEPLSWRSLAGLFHPEAGGGGGGYWHPLTDLSLILDHRLFGYNPAGYHGMNLLLHCLNVQLLFTLLYRMTARLWPSFAVALAFAVHPLNVEVVAWAVERKTLLSTLFLFLAMLGYLMYARSRTLGQYLLLILAFAASLMAKPAYVMLPALLLVLDIWPLGRCGGAEGKVTLRHCLALVPEKLPLLLLSVASVAISLSSFRESAELVRGLALPWSHRMAIAVVSAASYPLKVLWPVDLAVFYPQREQYEAWLVIICTLVLAAVSVAAFRSLKRFGWFFAGWGWYLVMLLPVSGLVQRGLWPEMADRFLYVPGIGLCMIIVWGGAELVPRIPRRAVALTGMLLVAFWGWRAWLQTGVWRNTETLFEHTLAVTRDNVPILEFLGNYRCQREDYERGIPLLARAAELKPASSGLERSLGQREMNRGSFEEAERHFQSALMLDETDQHALLYRAMSAERAGRQEQALIWYNDLAYAPGRDLYNLKARARERVAVLVSTAAPRLAVLEREAKLPSPRIEKIAAYALELDRLGFSREAYDAYRRLEAAGETRWQLYFNLGNVSRKLQRTDESVAYYGKVLTQRPDDRTVLNNLGVALKNGGRLEQALQQFERALAVAPDFAYARYNRANTLLALNRNREAKEAFQELERLHPEFAPIARRQIAGLERRNR